MNRRDFGKSASLLAAITVIAPRILAEPTRRLTRDGAYDDSTPEQRVAINRMYDNMPPSEIFKKVADSIPQEIPDGTNKKGWIYGSHIINGFIGGYPPSAFEMGVAPKNIDLSDVSYLVFYRQVVKKANEKPQGFASTVPLSFYGKVTHVTCIDIPKKLFNIDWKHEEVELMARESFLALQKLVKEYWEA